MTWRFSQSTGVITHDGVIITSGYAGKGDGKNNPEMQEVHNEGPLPRGLYQMGEPIAEHPHVGKYAIPLHPSMDNTMFGRSGFFWHGDSAAHPGDASDGCIVTGIISRMEAGASPDRNLEVTL